jgi:hypothetical protein
MEHQSLKRRRLLQPKRLAVAFALAPLGVTTVVAAIMVSQLRGPSDLVDGPVPLAPLIGLAAATGLGYVAGAVLLPVFFVLERLGKRGWRFYVPIAAVAGAGMGAVMGWPEPFSRPWGLYIACAATGALSGSIFSVALAWRSSRG